MPIFNEYSFVSSNCKNNIYVREWLPDDAPVGVVQLCHGVAEHISRYDAFAKYLASNGFVVVGNDHLGHGMSIADESELGFFGENGGWELVVGDMRKLYERMREQYRTLPYFIFGHSMGSFLTRTYAVRYHDGPDGIILSGTGQQPAPLLAAGLTLAKSQVRSKGASFKSNFVNNAAFGSYNNKVSPKRTEWDWLTSDPAVVDEYIADPLCGFLPTVGLFRDMLTGIKYISAPRNLCRVNKDLPIFIISGTADPVGDYGKGVLRAYNGYLDAGLTDVTLKLYNGARHELLNEVCKEDVYSDVLVWIKSKCTEIQS